MASAAGARRVARSRSPSPHFSDSDQDQDPDNNNYGFFEIPRADTLNGFVAALLAPRLSFWFIAYVLVLSAFQEEHPYAAGGAVLSWILVTFFPKPPSFQLLAAYLRFVLTRLPLYFFIGFVCAAFKLYARARYAPDGSDLRMCQKADNPHECLRDLLYGPLYYTVMQWVAYWPLGVVKSMAIDILREGLNVCYYYLEDVFILFMQKGLNQTPLRVRG